VTAASIGEAPPRNAAELARLSRRDERAQLALTAPALALIAVTLLLPLVWLLWQSFRGTSGFTLEHYAEVIERPAYLGYLLNTFKLSFLSTAICAALAYPFCYAMLVARRGVAAVLFACVIFSFFASLLVRTYAWLLLLQRRGVVNTWLIEHGYLEKPLELVYNLQGTIVGMVHILLPLMILPLYASMRNVDPGLVLAAKGLGATPARAFRDVFLPLSLPGLVAGGILVFVASLGFFLTPAMLGGGKVVVWATAVATAVEENPVWGAGSALGVILFVLTFATLYGLKRLFGVGDLLRRGA
jgi:putative spermidine/putrescine transport system permease protein/spermidine/putrescine transport system permease protein